MALAVAVDLGTTNTVIGIQTDSTGPRLLPIAQPVDQPRVLDPLDNLRSAVYFESETAALVGSFAAQRLESYRSIKSKMGTRWRVAHPRQPDRLLTPAYISAHILRAAHQAVRKQFADWDGSALITVPASFNSDQRADTIAAANLAGFGSVRLLDEPTAAYYYHFDQSRSDIEAAGAKTVLVFDFGGGTLDVSVIRIGYAGDMVSIDPIGRSRYNNLGGDDIDQELAALFLALWQKRSGTPLTGLSGSIRKSVLRLFVQRASAFKEEVEAYIAQGIPLNEFRIQEEVQFGKERLAIDLACELSREQYDELTGHFFHSKADLNIFKPIDQALEVARQIVPGFGENEIDLVLYTGGASRMTAVKAALEHRFAPKPCFPISDEEACNTVALGAASCRYDELYRGRSVRMSARLLESVLTRAQDGLGYVTLVPLTCAPSETFSGVETVWRAPRHLLRLRIPLFRGVGPHDHQLSPMGDLVLEFDEVIEEGTPYRFEYRMTSSKTLELKAVLQTPGKAPIEALGHVQLEAGARDTHKNPVLASVNGAT